MASSPRKSPKLRLGSDISDAKDRISQIEYVFCSQLYPKVQLNDQSAQEQCSAAKEATKNEYKTKEKNLKLNVLEENKLLKLDVLEEKLEINNLHREMQDVLEENKLLKLDVLEENLEINNLHREMQDVLEENKLLKLENMKFINMKKRASNRVHELHQELKQKITEVNEVRDLHQNLKTLLESKLSDLNSCKKAMKELEEKNYVLLNMQKKLEVETGELQLEIKKKSKELDEEKDLKDNELRNMETKVNGLLSELRDKTEEVCKGKELHENLLKNIEFQASEMMTIKKLLNQYGKENKLLAAEVQSLRSHADELEKELGNRLAEPQDKRKVRQQQFGQSDSFCSERIKRDMELDKFEEERKHLLEKQKILQEKVDMLQECLSRRTEESSQQIDAKDLELQSEKSKVRVLFSSYKQLKSQYNFFTRKSGLTEENMLSAPFDKIEIGSEKNMHSKTSTTLLDEKHTSKAHGTSDGMKQLDEKKSSDGKKKVVSARKPSPASPSVSAVAESPKHTSNTTPHPSAGDKRCNSYWRDTRSHLSRVGSDPHDDFLNTPLEKVRGNLGNIMKEDLPEHIPTITSLDDSDDNETQDTILNAGHQKLPTLPPKAGTSGFKYVETARKKTERENLKGVECKQCKKFYDAVLPGAGNDKNAHCEHHEGVSRHRYKYAPPMTPEGFWNIGFESEM